MNLDEVITALDDCGVDGLTAGEMAAQASVRLSGFSDTVDGCMVSWDGSMYNLYVQYD